MRGRRKTYIPAGNVRFAACTAKILFAGIIPIKSKTIISGALAAVSGFSECAGNSVLLAAFGLPNINIMQAATAIVPKNVIIAL